jgi:hypothetical protein
MFAEAAGRRPLADDRPAQPLRAQREVGICPRFARCLRRRSGSPEQCRGAQDIRRETLRVACQPKLTYGIASVSEGW